MGDIFTTTGTTNGAVAIKDVYTGMVVDGIHRNSHLMPIFGEPVDSGGGTKHQWHIRTGGNGSVEVFTEGQAQPAADSQDYVAASASFKYFRAMLQVTGHAKDAMRRNWFPALDWEMQRAVVDLTDLLNTTWMDATDGVQAAVDSTTTYAGVTRGSASYFEAYESAVGGIVGYSDMIGILQAMRDAERTSDIDMILCSHAQKTRIYNMSGQPGVKTIGPADAAAGYNDLVFCGIPVVAIPDMTNTVILFLNRKMSGNGPSWQRVVHRALDIKPMAPSGDSDLVQVSFSENLYCHDALRQGKLTSCTA